MKQTYLTMLLSVLISMVGAKAFAHDIEVRNADGVIIYYNYTNNSAELAVTYHSYFSYSDRYVGNVVIPESVIYNGNVYSVTSIGDYAFYECSGLTALTIPNSVTYIGDEAFSGCSGLTKVNISDIAAWCKISFDNYSSNPLYYAHHLYLNGEEVKTLVIPNSVTSIGNRAFSNCSGLTELTIPNSVTSIGNNAFEYCSGLTGQLIIPNSVTSIGNSAFSYCRGLTELTIGNSVTSIGDMAFYDCSGLTKVNISDIAAWCKISFDSSSSNPLYFAHHLYLNGEEVKTLVIPNSVTSIGESAFDGCSGLTELTIGNSVTSTSIGYAAFRGCRGLTELTIPNSVTSIGKFAFDGCI